MIGTISITRAPHDRWRWTYEDDYVSLPSTKSYETAAAARAAALLAYPGSAVSGVGEKTQGEAGRTSRWGVVLMILAVLRFWRQSRA